MVLPQLSTFMYACTLLMEMLVGGEKKDGYVRESVPLGRNLRISVS